MFPLLVPSSATTFPEKVKLIPYQNGHTLGINYTAPPPPPRQPQCGARSRLRVESRSSQDDTTNNCLGRETFRVEVEKQDNKTTRQQENYPRLSHSVRPTEVTLFPCGTQTPNFVLSVHSVNCPLNYETRQELCELTQMPPKQRKMTRTLRTDSNAP